MKYLVLLGRILFCGIFLAAIPNHFSEMGIQYGASKGVLMPNFLVPAAGVLLLLGGLSVLLGYKAKIGAWLLVAFLIPVSFIMHDFWNEGDAMMKQMQMAMFMKNMAMLGGAFLITYFGAGPLSIHAGMQKPATAREQRMAA
jgi:putative oxidoreductase